MIATDASRPDAVADRTIDRPRAAVTDRPRDPNAAAGVDFAAVLGTLQTLVSDGAPLPEAGSADVARPALTQPATSRADRLTQLRQADADHRSGGPPRIASAHIPRDQRIQEAAARSDQSAAGGKAVSSRRAPDSPSASAVSRVPVVRNGASQGAPAGRVTGDGTDVRANASDESKPFVGARVSEKRATRTPTKAAAVPSPSTGRRAAPPAGVSAPRPPVAGAVSRPAVQGGTRVAPSPTHGPAGETRTPRERRDGPELANGGLKRAAKPSIPRASPQRAAFERVAKIVRAGNQGSTTVARIELDPPALGHVRVNLRLNHDILHVRLAAETPKARDALMSQGGELRAALEQQGVRVQRMEFAAPQSDGQYSGGPTQDGSAGGLMSQSGTGDRRGGGSRMASDAADTARVVADGGERGGGEDERVDGVLGAWRIDVRV